MTIMPLVRHWWMMAIRGGLALLFGASILVWPHRELSTVVILFAAYALLDGAWALATAGAASTRLREVWPVCLEGMVSVALGLMALVWPLVSRELIYVIAGWGLVTGILEVIAAVALPRSIARHWLLGTGGVCSLFLAIVVVMLPHATIGPVATVLGTYALVFGGLVLLAALRFRHGHAGMLAGAK